MYQRIFVPVDDSSTSRRALDEAIKLLRQAFDKQPDGEVAAHLGERGVKLSGGQRASAGPRCLFIPATSWSRKTRPLWPTT